MLSKLTDTANILKAKITKDELEEKLVQATSEQNWQTPTNILHDIANAAYNYEKWQKINDFIWDKLKKKPTWRKIMKTLNLVEFLIKNGPPNSISSFKYDIYQFRSFSDYQARDDGIDRGEAIREKSKQIVELLSNQEHLQQEREKAKKIREKMSNITGGSTYGGYNSSSYGGSGSGSDGRYESFNSKNYNDKPAGSSYGSSNSNYGGLGVYGDYTSGKSTLDKYKTDKDKKPDNTPSINKPLIVPNITGVQQQQNNNTKKPFSQLAKKLEKPASKNQAVKPDPPSPTKNKPNPATSTSTNNGDLFDLMGDSTPAQVSTPSAPVVDQGNNHQNNGNSAHNGTNNQNIGFDFTQTTQTTQTTQVQNTNLVQPNLNFNLGFNQPVYNQQGFAQQGFNNQLVFNQNGFAQQPMGMNQPYGQPYNQAYGQPYGGQQQMYGQYQGYQAHQQMNSNPYQNFQPSPSISLTSPSSSLSSSSQPQITLSSKPSPSFDTSNSSSSSSNVKWLSNNEKGLIDFTDFTNQIKNSNTVNAKDNIMKSQSTGNNITIDMWKW